MAGWFPFWQQKNSRRKYILPDTSMLPTSDHHTHEGVKQGVPGRGWRSSVSFANSVIPASSDFPFNLSKASPQVGSLVKQWHQLLEELSPAHKTGEPTYCFIVLFGKSASYKRTAAKYRDLCNSYSGFLFFSVKSKDGWEFRNLSSRGACQEHLPRTCREQSNS